MLRYLSIVSLVIFDINPTGYIGTTVSGLGSSKHDPIILYVAFLQTYPSGQSASFLQTILSPAYDWPLKINAKIDTNNNILFIIDASFFLPLTKRII